MANKFFLHQIKQTNGTIEKGIVVKNTLDDALQGYHAYMGAYAYGHDANTDFVSSMISDMSGAIIVPGNGRADTWNAPEPEPVPPEPGE